MSRNTKREPTAAESAAIATIRDLTLQINPSSFSGGQCVEDPDNCWIDDDTGEHVDARTGARSEKHVTIHWK